MRYNGPERKPTRMRGYDYAEPGWYFITICTHERRQILSTVHDGRVELSQFGTIVDLCWQDLTTRYPHVELDAFVIMPDHIHGMFHVHALDQTLTRIARPTVANIVGTLKTESARRINNVRASRGAPLWQRSFYDHVIRDDADLERVRDYIADNPSTWCDGVRDDVSPLVIARR